MRKTFIFGIVLAIILLSTFYTKKDNFSQIQKNVFGTLISSCATDTSLEENDKIDISISSINAINVLYSIENVTDLHKLIL